MSVEIRFDKTHSYMFINEAVQRSDLVLQNEIASAYRSCTSDECPKYSINVILYR